MSNMGYDRNLTVFSPDGKLFQLEYAFKAVRLPGDTSIGVRGKDSVCLITTKKVEDKLIDASSVTRMFKITRDIGVCVTGRVPDARQLVYKCREIAANWLFDNGYNIPVKHLANEVLFLYFCDYPCTAFLPPFFFLSFFFFFASSKL